MADATTPNLGLTQPTVGADANTWGDLLNADLGIIDGLFATTKTTPLGTAALMASTDPHFISSGMILMWSGAQSAIPTGWVICDGTNGTPDLRDRFVIGAGHSYAVGAIGGEAVSNISVAGHALTSAEIPSFAATVFDPGHAHGVNDGGHSHNFNLVASGTGGSANGQSATGAFTALEDTSVATTGIGIDAASTGIAVTIPGGGQAHAHAASQDTNLPPYYALCFIMKS